MTADVVVITATVACVECTGQFRVWLDGETSPPLAWTLRDIALDAVRAGAVHDVITPECATPDNRCGLNPYARPLCPRCFARTAAGTDPGTGPAAGTMAPR